MDTETKKELTWLNTMLNTLLGSLTTTLEVMKESNEPSKKIGAAFCLNTAVNYSISSMGVINEKFQKLTLVSMNEEEAKKYSSIVNKKKAIEKFIQKYKGL